MSIAVYIVLLLTITYSHAGTSFLCEDAAFTALIGASGLLMNKGTINHESTVLAWVNADSFGGGYNSHIHFSMVLSPDKRQWQTWNDATASIRPGCGNQIYRRINFMCPTIGRPNAFSANAVSDVREGAKELAGSQFADLWEILTNRLGALFNTAVVQGVCRCYSS